MDGKETELTKLQQKELEILRVFIEVCGRLHLKYYLLAGTLLGAVRHRGFIPWDDDIDVAMLREDYEAFLAEAPKLLPEQYFLQNYHTDPEYPLGFSRIRDSRTTCIETRIKDKKIHHGIYIDLYALDCYPEQALRQKLVDAKQKLLALRLRSELTPADGGKRPSFSDRLTGALSKALRIRYPKAEDALREGERLFRSVPGSSLAANYYGCWGKKEIVPLQWFGEGTAGTFEGLEVTLPAEYDKWLTQVYGDYMELPPVEKRVARHDAVVIDTERPYTFYCDQDGAPKGADKMKDYEKEHAEFLRANGAGCTVLLKTDGAFPLDETCELALFGSGARRTVKGGTGSGEVNSRYFVTAEEGLEAAGFRVTSKTWLERYEEVRKEAKKRFIRELKRSALKRGTLAALDCMGAVMPEPEYDIPLVAAGDTAVYVLARISGEGTDRKAVPGDVLLTETEKRDILALERKYKKFLLVLNTGGVVDLSPVMEVQNILLLSQLGAETGNILADLILGKSAPSGKLAATWSAWEDYPRIGDFGERDDTRYREGVYVGYRYFDSAGKTPLFPFGYGLSYTQFSLAAGETSEENGRICLNVRVKNTGERSGREVAQLYVSPPQGRLDKPYQALAAFGKTKELAPGEEQELALSFDLRDLASYDEECAAWVLEAGDYVLRLGTSSRDTKPAAVVRLNGEAVVRMGKNCLGKPGFADWKPEARFEEVPAGLPVLPVDAAAFKTEVVNYSLPEEADPAAEALSDEELCLLNIGAFKRKGSASVIGDAAQSVAGAAGETVRLEEKGVPALVMADGPAGLRLSRLYIRDGEGAHALGAGMPESMLELLPAPAALAMKLLGGKGRPKGEIREQNCTAIPIGTALAQSWDLDFAERCGDIVGDEMERFGVHLWLAPALNIHRDIRCGRNFEYFSEDPLISGRFAAALTRGVQKHPGRGVTLKHFAANDQETNRYNNNSAVSERALREIYLRGFEIAVRESRPHALMTSYNLINGVHTSERRDLIEDVLRAEFGYRGIVMTDWIIAVMTGKNSKYAAPNAAKIAAAGSELVMPGCRGDYEAMRKGLADGTVSRRQLVINATRLIRTAKKTAGPSE